MSALLPLHAAAGGLAIVLGAVALTVKKGGTIHRRSGLLFVFAMVVLGGTAALLGLRNSLTDGNCVRRRHDGLLRRHGAGGCTAGVVRTRRLHVGALIVATGLALLDVASGIKAFKSPNGALGGVPFPMLFFIATVMSLGAIGDMRVIRFGMPTGRARLARHLWRMCFALFIAAGSFFSVRERVAKILPEPFATVPMRVLPILLVFVAMFYWLWRIGGRRTLPVIIRNPKPL